MKPVKFEENELMVMAIFAEKTRQDTVMTLKEGTPQQTFVKGYLYSFKMAGPEELLRLAAEGGIGEQCSQGFGYIEINTQDLIRNNKDK